MKKTIKVAIKLIFVTSLIYDVYAEYQQLNSNRNHNKTISDLEREQAEAIKKIVSSQIDYPVVTKKETNVNIKQEHTIVKAKEESEDKAQEESTKASEEVAKIKEQKERESIEQLRIKCQHLFKSSAKNDDEVASTTTFATAIPFGPVIKPEFLKHKPKFTTPSTTTSSFTKKDHILENSISTTAASSQQQTDFNDNLAMESTQPEPIVLKPILQTNEISNKEFLYPYSSQVDNSVKYVKLEPVILQRMLLSNGQNYFYWYRTVPNYVKYAYPYQYQGLNGQFQANTGQFQANAGQFQANTGQFQANVGQFQANTGQYQTNAGQYQTNAGQYQTNTVRYPASIGQIQGSSNGNYQVLNGHNLNGQYPTIYNGQYEVFGDHNVPIKNKPEYPKIVLIPPQKTGAIKTGIVHQKVVATTPRSTTTTSTTPRITSTSATTQSSTTSTTTPLTNSSPLINLDYHQTATSVSTVDGVNNGYKHEYKFVVPYNWNNAGKLYQQTDQFDPYAYYPKYFQPNRMNVQVPYVPTFHTINTLNVPNDELKSSSIEEKLSEIR